VPARCIDVFAGKVVNSGNCNARHSDRKKDLAHRKDFSDALEMLAEACEMMKKQGHALPVLVGGGAVELHTTSAFVTGDFDFVSSREEAFGAALEAAGFKREDRQGRLLKGWYHPESDIGVEIVSSRLYDGRADRSRLKFVEVKDGKGVQVAAIEDLIADRLAQFAAGPASDTSRLKQAEMLLKLAERVDTPYLDRRIKEETANEWDYRRLQHSASRGEIS